MSFSPVLPFHICVGTASLVSGTAAMIFRKGSPRHRLAGHVFVVSMLCLAASGAYLGFTRHQALNGLMGVLTFYLVVTAWSTARRGDGETGAFDWIAFLVPLAVAVALGTFGLEAANRNPATKDGYPAAAYFIFGSLALLLAGGDLRMLARGGVSGVKRIARHLGRMCLALFIATGSFFLGQQQVFPASWRNSSLLFIPSFLPLFLMIFWLVRVRFANAFKAMVLSRRG